MSRPHPNNSYYFLTTATFLHKPFFNTLNKKEIILNKIKNIKEKLKISFYAYSIVSNHYHVLFYLENGKNLFKVVQLLNGGSSFELNRQLKINQNIWDNYWTEVILNEKVFLKIIGYIIGNALKHRVVKNFKELKNYKFSSYNQISLKYGDEFAQNLVKEVINLELEEKKILKIIHS